MVGTMIKEMKLIETTKDSYPFQAAAGKCEFEKIGYVEDEYFMSGTANIYTEINLDHEVKPIYKDAP